MNKSLLKICVVAILALAVVSGCSSGTKVTTTVPSKQEQPRPIVNRIAFSYYASALIAEKEGQYPAAVANYEEALKHAPENSEILYALANLYFRLRQPEIALENARKIFYKDAQTYALIANCYRILGNQVEAERAYRKVLRMQPDDMHAHWFLGTFEKERGNSNEAIAHYAQVAKVNPSPAIYAEIAELETARRNDDAAIEAYRRSIALDPTASNVGAYMRMAALLRMQNRPDEAEQILLQGLEMSPEMHAFRLYLAEMYGDQNDTTAALNQVRWIFENISEKLPIINRAGQIAFELGALQFADSIFARELSQDPRSMYANFFRGRIAVYENRIEDAKGFFWKLVDVADSLPDGYINLGMIYLDQDSVDLAIDVLRDGVTRSTDGREDVQFYLATAFGRAERYSEALSIAGPLVKKYPDEIRFLFMLGSALERTSQHDSAAVVFERILETNPRHAPTMNYLGYMWADIGINLDESLELISTALEMDADNGAYLDSYGWILYKLGRYEDAEIQIRKAIDLMVEDDYILYEHLGDICFSLDKYNEARKNWQKALDLNPESEQIREKLTR
jgi:tetratricopeptide (TPR) repeat protein